MCDMGRPSKKTKQSLRENHHEFGIDGKDSHNVSLPLRISESSDLLACFLDILK